MKRNIRYRRLLGIMYLKEMSNVIAAMIILVLGIGQARLSNKLYIYGGKFTTAIEGIDCQAGGSRQVKQQG